MTDGDLGCQREAAPPVFRAGSMTADWLRVATSVPECEYRSLYNNKESGTMKDVLLGIVAGCLGAAVWAGVVLLTGYEVGYIAWGIGALVGWAVLMGNADGHRSSTAAGALAVVITILSIFAGKYAAIQTMVPSSEDDFVEMFELELLEDDESLIAMVADMLALEFAEEGQSLMWPLGSSYETARYESDYPARVWEEAESRWAETSKENQEMFREAILDEYRANLKELDLPQMSEESFDYLWEGSFGPMDLIFFGLGIVTAWKAGSRRKTAQQIQADYSEAMRLAVIHVLLADGEVTQDEVAMAAIIMQRLTGKAITTERIRAEATLFTDSDGDMLDKLNELGEYLNHQGRMMVVRAALLVAVADGDFAPEEQQLVQKIARAVGLSDEAFKLLVEETITSNPQGES
jgi:tellurite resistance protein